MQGVLSSSTSDDQWAFKLPLCSEGNGGPNLRVDIGASILRRGFWGPLYHNYNKEPPPKNSIGSYLGP